MTQVSDAATRKAEPLPQMHENSDKGNTELRQSECLLQPVVMGLAWAGMLHAKTRNATGRTETYSELD